MRDRLRVLLAVALCLILMSVATPSPAQSSAPIKFSPLVENLPGGQVDWGKEMFYASGEGAMPSASEEPNRARAKLKAKEYAKMQAIANLLMLIEGTSISYEATGKDFMAQDISLRQKIEGYVKNVNVLRSVALKEEGDTIIKVTVGTPMYGRDTPGSALLQAMSESTFTEGEPEPVKVEVPKIAPKPTEVKPKPKPEPKLVVAKTEPPKVDKPKPVEPKIEPAKVDEPEPVQPKIEEPRVDEPKAEEPKCEDKPVVTKLTPDVAPKSIEKVATPEPPPVVAKVVEPVEVAGGPYTSVIVDSLGFNVMRAMSPKIRTRDGDEVWGTIKMSADEVQDHGPVAYTRSLADAKKCPRAGTNPLVLKAIGRAGGSRMCDVVLADEDVSKLRSADQAARPSFLAELRVVVVVDPAKAF